MSDMALSGREHDLLEGLDPEEEREHHHLGGMASSQEAHILVRDPDSGRGICGSSSDSDAGADSHGCSPLLGS